MHARLDLAQLVDIEQESCTVAVKQSDCVLNLLGDLKDIAHRN